MSGVFPVDRRREGTYVNCLSYASGVVVGLSGKDAEISLTKMVVVVCSVLHDCRFETAAALAGRGEMFLSPFLDSSLGFTDILARAWDAVRSRAAEMVNDTGCCGFLQFILWMD